MIILNIYGICKKPQISILWRYPDHEDNILAIKCQTPLGLPLPCVPHWVATQLVLPSVSMLGRGRQPPNIVSRCKNRSPYIYGAGTLWTSIKFINIIFMQKRKMEDRLELSTTTTKMMIGLIGYIITCSTIGNCTQSKMIVTFWFQFLLHNMSVILQRK